MKIEIRGLDELVRRFGAGGMHRRIRQATEEAVLTVHDEVPEYPAKRPGQIYQRTDLLVKSITTEVRSMGSETVGTIGTNTVYAPYVIGEKQVGTRGPQAWMHKGRWWTLEGHVRSMRNAIKNIYLRAIRRALSE
jgi:hypothetical protein